MGRNVKPVCFKGEETEKPFVIAMLNYYSDQCESIRETEQRKIDEAYDWCNANRKSIRKLFPKVGTVLRVKNIKDLFDFDRYIWEYLEEDGVYFFKVTSNQFRTKDYFSYNQRELYVRGQVLDVNLKPVMRNHEIANLCDLEEITKKNDPSNFVDNITKVYVMIDKNTGYYKIGKSNNPIRREKTLQSEKPTIELLFHCDARIKDEKILHTKFKDKRIRGEWFDLNGSDLIFIKKYFSAAA